MTGVSAPLVVGGDISLTASGLAWPDGTVLTHGRDGLTNPRVHVQERGRALMELTVELGSLIATRALPGAVEATQWPVLVVVENLPTTGANVQVERCYLWLSLVNFLGRCGVPVLEVAPSVVKKYACGLGNANKREVWAGVAEWFPQFEIHRVGKTGKVLTSPDFDRADAVTLMTIGCELLGEPLVELPAKHRKALDGLELPPGVTRV